MNTRKLRAFTPLEGPRFAGTQMKSSNRASSVRDQSSCCVSKRFLTGPVRKISSNGAGFTLVELLVVIAIIALLMSILMPSLSRAKEQARKIICQNNLKEISLGDQMYAQDSDDWHVPAFYNDISHDPPEALWFQNPLFSKIMTLKGRFNKEDELAYEEKSMTLPKDLKCPTDKRTLDNGGLHLQAGQIIQGVSYAMNMMGIRPSGGWRWNIVYALKVSEVVKPAEKIHFMDGQWFVVYIGGAEYKRVWDVIGDRMGAWEWDAASYRHDEGANIAFYDGHVEYWPKEKICPYLPNLIDQFKARNAIWLPIPGQEFLPEAEP